MRGKKFLLALMSVLMMTSVGVACGEETPEEDNNPSSSQTRDITITLDKTEATMNIFDTLTLEAGVKGAEKDELEWSSSNEDVAIVEDGVVTPVSAGVTTITAFIGEEAYAECEVNVEAVEGPVQLIAPEDEIELEIKKSKSLAVVGYAKTIELTHGVYSYEINKEGKDIVSVDEEGVVTALKKGTATITVNATFDGFSEEDQPKAKEIKVSVIDVVRKDMNSLVTVYENRIDNNGNVSIDLSDYTELTGVTKVAIGDTNYKPVYTESNNVKTLNIAKSDVKDSVVGGENKLFIEGTTSTGKIELSGEMFYVDYAIGTIDELNAFGSACNTNTLGKSIYAILTDDIDYRGSSFTNVFPMANGVFSGTLDGQGYTISNVTFTHSLFPVIRKATIKNIAFVNLDKNTKNGGGFLANELSNSLVDNVYIYGRVTKHTVGDVGSVYGYGKSVVIKNSFFNFDFASNPKTTPVLSYTVQADTKFENVRVLSTNSNGNLYHKEDDNTTPTPTKDDNTKLYTSVEAFQKEVSSVPMGFDTDYWTMEDGMLTMIAPNALPVRTLVGEQVVAKNRGGSLQYDLSGFNVDSLESVTIGGYKVDKYAYANNKLTVETVNIPKTSGHVEVSIITKTQKIKANAYVVDYAIGSVAELNAFGAYIDGLNVTSESVVPEYVYAILTDNIDYNNGNWYDVYDSGFFNGTFDGQGYAISNVKVKNSFFVGIRGQNSSTNPAIIKNVAFVNIDKATANGGGILANYTCNAHITNVYISGKTTVNTGAAGAIYGYGPFVTIKNCLFELDFQSNAGQSAAISNTVQQGTTYENVYAISTNSNGKLYAGTTPTETNTKLYTSINAFKAEVTAVPYGFNTEYWEMENGKLVFKNA